MPDTTHPMPSTGGSYLRAPDGSLTRIEDAEAADAPQPAPKTRAKPATQED